MEHGESTIPALDAIREMAARVVHAEDHELDAHCLVIALTHVTDAVTTVPRVLITGQRGKGKTTMLNLAERLSFNAENITDVASPHGLRAIFSDNREEGCTIVQDEVHVLFGPSGLRGSGLHVRSILNRGYEEGTTYPMPVGRSIERIPIYAVAFMAGIGDHCVPDDLYDRSIRIRMKPKPDSVRLLNSRSIATKEMVSSLHEPLHRQLRTKADDVKKAFRSYESYHKKLRERTGEIWGPLFALAEVAGGDWPERCRKAFEIMGCDGGDDPFAALLPSQLMLIDMATVFAQSPDAEYLSVRDIANRLIALPERGQRYKNYGDNIWEKMYEATGVRTTVKKIPGSEETVRVRFARDVVPAAQKLLDDIAPVAEDGDGESEIDQW